MTSTPQNLYALSELAQHLIKVRAHLHSWPLQSYPGKVKLYSDILRPLPSADAVNQVRPPTFFLHHGFDSRSLAIRF